MSNNNYDSINNDDESAEIGNLNMQELDAPVRPSRVVRNRLISVVSIALAVVGVTLFLASSRGTANLNSISEPTKKTTPISSLKTNSLLNAETPTKGVISSYTVYDLMISDIAVTF